MSYEPTHVLHRRIVAALWGLRVYRASGDLLLAEHNERRLNELLEDLLWGV